MTYVGALLPDGFALSEWQVVSESAVPSQFGERRIVAGSCRSVLLSLGDPYAVTLKTKKVSKNRPPVHVSRAASSITHQDTTDRVARCFLTSSLLDAVRHYKVRAAQACYEVYVCALRQSVKILTKLATAGDPDDHTWIGICGWRSIWLRTCA